MDFQYPSIPADQRGDYRLPRFPPWWHEYGEEYSLCSRCDSIRFWYMFRKITGVSARHVHTLGQLGDAAANSYCPACRFFHAMKNIHSEDGVDEGREYVLWNLRPNLEWEHIDHENLEYAGSILAVVDQQIQQEDVWDEVHAEQKYRQRCIGSASVCLGQNLGRTPSQYTFDEWQRHPEALACRLIKAENFNYSTAHDWLQLCQNHHGHDCNFRNEVANVKLIDCDSGRIVLWNKEPPPFFILSNVDTYSTQWTRAVLENDKPAVADSLPAILPPTVRDAVAVTKALGYHWLWIDRYCIDTNPPESERSSYYEQRHAIYSAAEVTIMAAVNGSAPDYGLPGVGQTQRRPQAAVKIGHQILVAVMTDTLDYSDNSTLRSPIWGLNTPFCTLEEGYCAHRLLVFTDQEVYWDCRGGKALESVQGLFKARFLDYRGLKNFLQAKKPWPSSFDQRQADLQHLCSSYDRFSSRKLHNRLDTLNDFRAALLTLCNRQSPFHKRRVIEYMGVHITNSAHDQMVYPASKEAEIEWIRNAFLASLCFIHDAEHGDRDESFPSWSGAGWKAKKLNNTHEEFENCIHQFHGTPTQIAVETVDSRLMDWRVRANVEDCIQRPERYSHFIHIEGWVLRGLNIQWMPNDAQEWTRSYLNRTHDDCQFNISGFFAVFKNTEQKVNLPLYSMYYSMYRYFGANQRPKASEMNTPPSAFAFTSPVQYRRWRHLEIPLPGEIVGLVLGNCEDPEDRGVFDEECVTILLLQNTGQGFWQRVGHARWLAGHMHLEPHQPDHRELASYKELVFGEKRRYSVRIK